MEDITSEQIMLLRDNLLLRGGKSGAGLSQKTVSDAISVIYLATDSVKDIAVARANYEQWEAMLGDEETDEMDYDTMKKILDKYEKCGRE